jgi:hypothetical protein
VPGSIGAADTYSDQKREPWSEHRRQTSAGPAEPLRPSFPFPPGRIGGQARPPIHDTVQITRPCPADTHLFQSQTTATRTPPNRRPPTGSSVAQSATTIRIVRATLTRVGHHSCQCASMPRTIGRNRAGAEASDEVRIDPHAARDSYDPLDGALVRLARRAAAVEVRRSGSDTTLTIRWARRAFCAPA